jgi:NUMOD4 motif
MSEEWEDVLGFEGHYEVSDQGRIASVTRHEHRHCRHCGEPTHNVIRKGRFLKPRADSNGTLTVGLAIPGKERKFKYVGLARLILTAFKRPPREGEVAFHLDGDHTNNALSNLVWVAPESWTKHRVARVKRIAKEKREMRV